MMTKEDIIRIYPELTKSYILRYITELDIFEKYLGIRIVEDEPFCNPLRIDNNPTCKIFTDRRGKIRLQDFAGYTHNGRFKTWDCWDTATNVINNSGKTEVRYFSKTENKTLTKKIGLDIWSSGYFIMDGTKISKRKLSFTLLLKDIAKRFKLHKYSEAKTKDEIKLIKADKSVVKVKPKDTIITFKPRLWYRGDNDLWGKYHVNIDNPKHRAWIKYFSIYPVYEAYLNGRLIYSYTRKDPCYAYIIGKDKVKTHIKLYFPFRNKPYPRFITNTQVPHGYRKVIPTQIGIIHKSTKDNIIFHIHFLKRFNISGFAVSQENTLIPKKVWDYVKRLCNMWLTLFDFDYAGVRTALLHYSEYGIEPLFFVRKDILTRGDIRRLKQEFKEEHVNYVLRRDVDTYFTDKDSSDIIESIGVETFSNIIERRYEDYKGYLEDIEEYNFNLLKWIK